MPYSPLVVNVTQSKYGYWLVTISVAPGERWTVMMCSLGISRQEAATACLASVLPALTPGGGQ